MHADVWGKARVAPRQYPPSQQDVERGRAALEQFQQQQREVAAARQLQLRNAAQLRSFPSLLNDDEEDVHYDWNLTDPATDGDWEGAGEEGQGASSSASGASHQRRSHTENVRRREVRWREEDKLDIQLTAALAEQLARHKQEDLLSCVNAVQQRIDDYVRSPTHPCPGGGSVSMKGRRAVVLHTLMGYGILYVPQFTCSKCGQFEMSPLVVGSARSSPNPTIWYDYWLCAAAKQFETIGGVANTTFCSCVDAMAADAEQLGADPRVPLSLSAKTLSDAVRHHMHVQREYTDPARHGADIFGGALGHCPPCAGAALVADAAMEGGPAVGGLGGAAGGVSMVAAGAGTADVAGTASGGEAADEAPMGEGRQAGEGLDPGMDTKQVALLHFLFLQVAVHIFAGAPMLPSSSFAMAFSFAIAFLPFYPSSVHKGGIDQHMWQDTQLLMYACHCRSGKWGSNG